MKFKELMERKRGQREAFGDYVSDMHNLHFKLNHKIDEDDFVELLKDNMNSQMGGLLLTSPLPSLAEFKKEGLRVDRWLKNTAKKHDHDHDSFCEVIPCGPHRLLRACYVRPSHRKRNNDESLARGRAACDLPYSYW